MILGSKEMLQRETQSGQGYLLQKGSLRDPPLPVSKPTLIIASI